MTLVQLAVAWVLANPTVTAPIVGASRPEHLTESLQAADLTLSPDLQVQLEALTHQYR